MRLTIDHRTVYRFEEPQARIVQLLRMTPGNSDDQLVADWHITVDRNAHMTNQRDGFGNLTTMLYCEGPVQTIEIAVTGEVVTGGTDGLIRGAAEPLPAPLFHRATPLTTPGAALAAFARDAAAADDVAGLHRFNGALNARFALSHARPDTTLGADAAFERDRATPRDMAQMFVAGARALGVPARYVSGYCDLAGDRDPTPHGWAEAWIAGLGWVGFDPSLGMSPAAHHVRVAVALDAAGAAPIAGSRLGEGGESLDVAIRVSGSD